MAGKKQTRKRQNGQGTVYQVGEDGPWIAALTVGVTASGKPKRITRQRHSKADARQALDELLQERDGGLLTSNATEKLGQYLWDWIENTKRPAVREGTFLTAKSRIKHVAAHLGTVPLGKVSPQQIQRLYRTLEDALAPATIAQVHVQLKAALADAVRWGIIPRNPCDLVSPPKVEEREHTTINPEQLARLLAELEPHPLYPLYLLLALTGVREGEALALRWEDIDRDRGIMHIRQTFTRSSVSPFGPTKTLRSRRTIKLDPMLLPVLRQYEQHQRLKRIAAPVWQYPERVFTTDVGGVVWPARVTQGLKAALERAGLPDMRVHDLRHTFATTLARNHVQPHTLRQVLGHSSLATTLGIYGHVLEEMEEEAMQVMGDALRTGQKSTG